MKITIEVNKYLSSFSKIIPILGSIIGDIFDEYNIYVIGDNTIKYFKEYIIKIIGCYYLIRKKNVYIKSFD